MDRGARRGQKSDRPLHCCKHADEILCWAVYTLFNHRGGGCHGALFRCQKQRTYSQQQRTGGNRTVAVLAPGSKKWEVLNISRLAVLAGSLPIAAVRL